VDAGQAKGGFGHIEKGRITSQQNIPVNQEPRVATIGEGDATNGGFPNAKGGTPEAAVEKGGKRTKGGARHKENIECNEANTGRGPYVRYPPK